VGRPVAAMVVGVTAGEWAAFVREHTGLGVVPFVPELRLYQAEDAIGLWEETEARHGGPGLAPPFWAFPWAGGQALARYVLDHPSLVAGRAVCDIAAGSGLVALAAARAGAARVTAVEIDPYATAAIALNATANDLDVTPLLTDLLAERAVVPVAEVVLAGDVFYNRDMATRMLAFFRAASDRGALVLVGDPGRAYVPTDVLERVAEYDVPVVRDLEDAEVRRTMVWRLPASTYAVTTSRT
jgi:predicted nicotinamide N-methyase